MAKSKRIIVSVTNDLSTDQRVDKVCRFLTDQGYSVLLVGRLRKNSRPLVNRPYKTKRMRLLFDKGALFYAAFNIRLYFFLLVRRTDFLLANDLDTLLGNYVASKFKSSTEIIYDSHEFFTEVPELQGRRAKEIWEGIEAWLLPKIEKCYTVNESIAKLYFEKYGKQMSVVRNISPVWIHGDLLTKEELGLPNDKKIVIIQGAGINVDRGAEEAVEAMKTIDNAVLIIVGDGDVVPDLKREVSDNQLEEKVLFFPKQEYSRMMNYTYHADIGLTLDKDSNINYQFSLPNKVFDYIHAGTPIIATNLVEVARIVDDYNVGLVLDSFNASTLSGALNDLLSDDEKLLLFKANCKIAQESLNWGNETKVLESIYPKCEVVK